MMTQPRTLARSDLLVLTPDRLADVVDYSFLAAHPSLTHRGHDVDVDRLVSRLGAALDAAAVDAGDAPAPSTLEEQTAVTVVANAFATTVPRWLGDSAELESSDQPVSDVHLDVDDLTDAYWHGELAPATMPVAGDDWPDQKRIILPFLALAWERLDAQLEADRTAAIEAGQSAITRQILTEAVQRDLSRVQVDEAVADAQDALARRRESRR
jgi:hypothetical protein